MEEVMSAATSANAHAFITKLPDGYVVYEVFVLGPCDCFDRDVPKIQHTLSIKLNKEMYVLPILSFLDIPQVSVHKDCSCQEDNDNELQLLGPFYAILM